MTINSTFDKNYWAAEEKRAAKLSPFNRQYAKILTKRRKSNFHRIFTGYLPKYKECLPPRWYYLCTERNRKISRNYNFYFDNKCKLKDAPRAYVEEARIIILAGVKTILDTNYTEDQIEILSKNLEDIDSAFESESNVNADDKVLAKKVVKAYRRMLIDFFYLFPLEDRYRFHFYGLCRNCGGELVNVDDSSSCPICVEFDDWGDSAEIAFAEMEIFYNPKTHLGHLARITKASIMSVVRAFLNHDHENNIAIEIKRAEEIIEMVLQIHPFSEDIEKILSPFIEKLIRHLNSDAFYKVRLVRNNIRIIRNFEIRIPLRDLNLPGYSEGSKISA